jgi:hypothetical protein
MTTIEISVTFALLAAIFFAAGQGLKSLSEYLEDVQRKRRR